LRRTVETFLNEQDGSRVGAQPFSDDLVTA
jgi:hypothetical protein